MNDALTSKQQDQLAEFVRSFGLIARLLGWLEITQLKHVLTKSEEIEAMVYGIHQSSFVLLVATNKRLHFIDKGWFHSRVEDYQYSHVESIEYDNSLIAGMVRIQAAQGTVFLKFAPNRFIYKFVNTVESHMGQNHDRGTSSLGDVDQLDKLAQLHKAGELTDQEFAAEKAKIIK